MRDEALFKSKIKTVKANKIDLYNKI